MTRSTSDPAPDPDELDALLRLLDDETPEVRDQVTRRLEACGGDLSEFLAGKPASLGPAEIQVLSDILHKARRRHIERDWLVPSHGAAALREDWESFEALLRTLSDFLHDGITCRQPLTDALDLLAEEADADGILSAGQLAGFLFGSGMLCGNQEGYEDPRNTDLAWAISEGKSNPIGLSVIFTLVARRMGLVVEAVNFPAHFMCRIHEDGHALIVDCFNRGQQHAQASLLANPDLSPSARRALQQTADPGTILIRMLNNLNAALLKHGRMEDAELVRKLRSTLE